ncbi:hypothetical protein AGLY_000838 [Aphis glycines]|uniref:Uncharacterized protein n=1 Tax=Aphis glycines TaxID=307491 RepID=A0A6G0U837_APHGL|nr:hypothetical protein AGLY_000838 [Aphis glycines]
MWTISGGSLQKCISYFWIITYTQITYLELFSSSLHHVYQSKFVCMDNEIQRQPYKIQPNPNQKDFPKEHFSKMLIFENIQVHDHLLESGQELFIPHKYEELSGIKKGFILLRWHQIFDFSTLNVLILGTLLPIALKNCEKLNDQDFEHHHTIYPKYMYSMDLSNCSNFGFFQRVQSLLILNKLGLTLVYTYSAILARLSCDRNLYKYTIISSHKSSILAVSLEDLGCNVSNRYNIIFIPYTSIIIHVYNNEHQKSNTRCYLPATVFDLVWCPHSGFNYSNKYMRTKSEV